MENEKATILWDSPIITDRHVPCNKPDIVIQEKKSDRCQIIDVAIPSDYNIQKKATEKMRKYFKVKLYSLEQYISLIEDKLSSTTVDFFRSDLKKSTVVDESLSSIKLMYCSREYNFTSRFNQQYEKSTSNEEVCRYPD